MITYSPSDVRYAITKETEAGVTPANPVWLRYDHIPGTSVNLTSDFVEASVVTAGRASGGSSKTNFRVEGGLKSNLNAGEAFDLLLQSSFAGEWVEAGEAGEGDDVLKASDKDTSISVRKTLGGATPLTVRNVGLQVSKFTLSCEASGMAEAQFDFMGMGRVPAAQAVMAGETFTDASDKVFLSGKQVSVTIGGLTGVQYRSFELSVEQTKEAFDTFGTDSAAGIGTSGNRKTNLNITFYRKDLNPETLFGADGTVPVTITVGVPGNGYSFTIPAATSSVPTDEEDGAKMLVSLEMTAKRDNAAGTDIFATRL
ncbi:phage tail tube protein [Brevundimonas sp. NPDC058933]|uniref:phage tail tube protein n=1 Tax=Brevundimonas sp. NPDC058933 TaxID=3346673 RepID=UPI003BEF3F8B